jgi:UDP-N-acetylmuramate--alanine ligase
VICEIYPAGESGIDGIDGERLAKAISEAGHAGAVYGGSLSAIEAEWPGRFEPGELVLTLGAGNVVTLGPRLLAALEAARRGDS